MSNHEYEPCTHEGRHGYTMLDAVQEYEMCERCRRGPGAHPVSTDDMVAKALSRTLFVQGQLVVREIADDRWRTAVLLELREIEELLRRIEARS